MFRYFSKPYLLFGCIVAAMVYHAYIQSFVQTKQMIFKINEYICSNFGSVSKFFIICQQYHENRSEYKYLMTIVVPF